MAPDGTLNDHVRGKSIDNGRYPLDITWYKYDDDLTQNMTNIWYKIW